MFVTNHALAGALLGLRARRAAAVAPLAFAAHLAMDRVPHWGDGGDRDRFLRVARVDGLTMLAAIAATAAMAPPARRWPVAVAAAACVAPDLDKPMRHFGGRSPFPDRFDRFHQRLQEGRESPDRLRRELGIAAALAVAYTAGAVTARRR